MCFPTLHRLSNPDGTFSESGPAAHGGTVSRVYDAAGTLTGELWKQANGDEVSRTFYEQGQVKASP